MNEPFEPDAAFNERTSELDLGALSRAMLRKKHWIIWPTLAAFLGVGLYVMLAKPMYTAEAQVLLENQESFLTRAQRAETPSDTSSLDAESVGSQVQLVTSRDLARRAVDKLGLVGNPEFDPAAKGVGPIGRVLILFGLKRDPTRVAPEDRVVDTFERRLTVFSPTKTRVLTIEFRARDPNLAARAANEIVALYLETQSDAKRQRAKTAAVSLSRQIAELRTKLTAAADAVEHYRTTVGLLAGSNNMTIIGQQLADLSGALSKARTDQADAQAKATLVRELIRSGRIADVADVANNDFVRRIAEQVVTAKAQLALELRTLLPGHPRIKELTAKIADLETQLHAAAIKIASTLENNGRIAQARVANLETAIDQQKGAVSRANADEVHLHELQRVAQALRDQLDASMAKYQEALARETSPATPADARMITRAVAPDQPSFPKKIPMLAFGTFAAFVLSSAAVIASELLVGSGGPSPELPVPGPRAVDEAAPKTVPPAKILERLHDVGAEETRLHSTKNPVSDTPDETPTTPAEPAISAIGASKERGARVVATCVAADQPAAAALLAFARGLGREGRPILIDLDAKGSELAALLKSDEKPAPRIERKMGRTHGSFDRKGILCRSDPARCWFAAPFHHLWNGGRL